MPVKSRILVCAALCLAAVAGCRARDASIVSMAKRAPWKTPQGEGVRLTTKHYDIYTTVKDPRMQAYFPGFMEAAYLNYLSLTGLRPRRPAKPMPIYMMATREQWADLTRRRLKEQAGPYLSIQAGGYCHDGVCVFWQLTGRKALSVASHEGLHQLFHHRLRHHLPMWLEEGLCTVAEGHHVAGQAVRFTPDRNLFRFENLRTAIINGQWIPLRRLLHMDAGEAIEDPRKSPVGYYGQVWALARLLRSNKRYAAGVRRMLADAEAGTFHKPLKVPRRALAELQLRARAYNRTISEPLFKHYISKDLEGFEREYKAYARKITKLE
ncbi:MAG: hypothetical protein ISS78_01955 [Phycisphaerae bacterium]|nr:hypothetical protein [Phycisphaerae bacterium]